MILINHISHIESCILLTDRFVHREVIFPAAIPISVTGGFAYSVTFSIVVKRTEIF